MEQGFIFIFKFLFLKRIVSDVAPSGIVGEVITKDHSV
jgi:hypothetical protein